jgi:hypothetical protein
MGMMDLNPCKCGRTSEDGCVHTNMVYVIEDDYKGWVVMCENCDEETDLFNYENDAIEAWNKTGE